VSTFCEETFSAGKGSIAFFCIDSFNWKKAFTRGCCWYRVIDISSSTMVEICSHTSLILWKRCLLWKFLRDGASLQDMICLAKLPFLLETQRVVVLCTTVAGNLILLHEQQPVLGLELGCVVSLASFASRTAACAWSGVKLCCLADKFCFIPHTLGKIEE
jgi:hypothetical protein